MTLTTVNDPRRFAKTSIRPRYGLSLKRTGAFFSSLDAKVTGALERIGAPPVAKATTSRFGALAREVKRTRFKFGELVDFGAPLFAVDEVAWTSPVRPELPSAD